MADDVGALVARVVADTAQFRTDMAKAAATVQSSTARMNRSLAEISKHASAVRGSFNLLNRGLGLFGLALSTQALSKWIMSGLEAKDATDEQREALAEARAAMASLSASSQSLAGSVALELVPAMRAATAVMIGWNRLLFRADPFPVEAQIESVTDKLKLMRAQFAASQGMPQGWRDEFSNQITAVESQLDELLKKQRQLLGLDPGGVPGSNQLQEIDHRDFIPLASQLDEMPSFRPVGPEVLTGIELPGAGSQFDRGQILPAEEERREAMREIMEQTVQEREAHEQRLTDIVAQHAQRRTALEETAAHQEIALRQGVTDNAMGLLGALGAEHRGAGIALLLWQKAMSIKEVMVNAAKTKALVAANYEVAIAAALAIPIYGEIKAAALRAQQVAAVARIGTTAAFSAGLIGVTGAIEASQLSHGGTQATLGTSANPITTSSGNSNIAADMASGRKQKVVEFHIHGNVYGAGGIRKLAEDFRDVIDDADIVLIGPDSLQASLIRGGD